MRFSPTFSAPLAAAPHTCWSPWMSSCPASPATRSALVPFLASPDLLAIERQRGAHDQMNSGGFAIGDEPSGRVTLADLGRSRRVMLRLRMRC